MNPVKPGDIKVGDIIVCHTRSQANGKTEEYGKVEAVNAHGVHVTGHGFLLFDLFAAIRSWETLS